MTTRRAPILAAGLCVIVAVAAPAAQRVMQAPVAKPAVPAAAAVAAKPAIAALARVEAGLWELREAGAPVRSLCVVDPAALTQPRHAGADCTRLVIADGERAATVQYSCAAAGWGRTTLRTASATSVRIDTQGIADNAPFAFVAEAHRTGDCAPAGHAAR